MDSLYRESVNAPAHDGVVTVNIKNLPEAAKDGKLGEVASAGVAISFENSSEGNASVRAQGSLPHGTRVGCEALGKIVNESNIPGAGPK